jgi:hypothetical protein
MSAAFTFGSIGDIIAICQIAWSLGKALSDSAEDYQNIKHDLETFTQILMQVC